MPRYKTTTGNIHEHLPGQVRCHHRPGNGWQHISYKAEKNIRNKKGNKWEGAGNHNRLYGKMNGGTLFVTMNLK